ncbi:MAG: alpha-ketoglutarate-dependent dioxygenase AlkB [Pseudomonadota bacterium]
MADLFAGQSAAPVDLNGVTILPGYLDRAAQTALVGELRGVAGRAPFRQYTTPGGRQMSVAMTAAGALGWMTDTSGYRYAARHQDGQAWPDIPPGVLRVWRDVSGVACDPDSCLINFYGDGARMGMHQDKDEADIRWPVVSISLGDDALFRVGGVERPTPSKSHWLKSGDVAIIGGDARLAYHGIDRIRFGSSDLLSNQGRLNVTLRVAG